MLAKITGLFIAVLPVLAPLNADIVYSNAPAFGYQSIAYSDAFSSEGNNWQKQSAAQRIVLNESYDLNAIRWWGGMNNYIQTGNENLAGFEIILWNEDFSEQVVNKIVYLDAIEYTNTGFTNANGEVYEFFSLFDYSIQQGIYHLNIGALYHEISGSDYWGGDGRDQWIWSTGENYVYDSDLAQRYNFSITSNFPPVQRWGRWNPSEKNFGTYYNQGGAVKMYAVPEAGSLALLGLATLIGGRRRR